MPDAAKPREPESSAPDHGSGNAMPAPSGEQPVVWPRDLNAAPAIDPIWGSDPESLRDA